VALVKDAWATKVPTISLTVNFCPTDPVKEVNKLSGNNNLHESF